MAYADLGTFLPGDILTAADLTQTRDNFEFIIAPPRCVVFHTVGTSCADGADTILLANSESVDSDAMHSTVSNTGRVTFQTAGDYDLLTRVQCPNGAGSRRLTQFRFNGTTAVNGDQRSPVGSTFSTIITTGMTYTAAAGDYVEVRFNQNSGGALTVILLELSARFRSR